MIDFLDFIKIMLVTVASIVIFMSGVMGVMVGIQAISIKFVDNVPVIIKVDKKIVYQGISAGVNVSSKGANTLVTINKPPLYFLPKAYYISKDVEVINK